MAGKGMGGHHRPNEGEKDEWLTPPWLLQAVGPFDLDPCAAVGQPWPTARRQLTRLDDGLTAAWRDDEFVWCNPPYGPRTWEWLRRLSSHPAGGIALVFARTETDGFFSEVWQKSSAQLFLRGRLFFHHASGEVARHNAGAPSVLVAYGREGRARLQGCGLRGALVETWKGVRTR